MVKRAKVPLHVLVVDGTRRAVKELADVLECSQGEVVDRAIVLLRASENEESFEQPVPTPLPAPKGLESPVKRGIDGRARPTEDVSFEPREIPGVSVGPPKREVVGGFPCRCVHSGCRGSKFTGTARFQNICPECSESGHKGEPRNCQSCADDSATGAL